VGSRNSFLAFVFYCFFFFIADLSGGNLRTVGMKEAGDDGWHVTVRVGT
jgi:hypothetical protein